jgi:hypothetical protein
MKKRCDSPSLVSHGGIEELLSYGYVAQHCSWGRELGCCIFVTGGLGLWMMMARRARCGCKMAWLVQDIVSDAMLPAMVTITPDLECKQDV